MNIFLNTNKHLCCIKCYIQNPLWLLILTYCVFSPPQAFALTTEETLFNATGGKIVRLLNNTNCLEDCSSADPDLTSYIAIQNKGYRFDSWTGDCSKSLGRICTLNTQTKHQISARFVKVSVQDTFSKVLLLVNDTKSKPTIWNDFVRQQFDNRCPIIYGGIVLGKDAYNPHKHVYCYRIAFGYLDQLNHNLSSSPSNKTDSNQYASHEILAALLGILNRHPQLSLTLVSQQNSSLAALAYLHSETTDLIQFNGLLNLYQNAEALNAVEFEISENEWRLNQIVPSLNLEAKPQQTAKINNALSSMTKAWWLLP